MNELIAGTIAAPKDLPADAVGSVGTPNTLPADNAASVGTPNTVPSDSAGIIAAPISLPSQGAAALPRSLTPMVEFDFAAKRYVQDGVAVAFEDIFTYTRASSASFINRRLKKGGGYDYFLDTDYVGDVENLAKNSEDFTDADWVKSATTVTSNETTSPFGDKTADRLLNGSGVSSFRVQQTVTTGSSQERNFSCYVKIGPSKENIFSLALYDNVFAETAKIEVNLLNGVITSSTGADISSSCIYVADGWYLCSISALCTPEFTGRLRVGTGSGVGDKDGYIWGAQISRSAKTLPYVKALDTRPTKTFAETLRTEYDPATGENIGALSEAFVTNTATRSEEFTSGNWSNQNLTISANMIIAPDGTLSADLLIPVAANLAKSVRQDRAISSGVEYATSIFAKAGGKRYIQLSASNGGFGTDFANFDLQTGTITRDDSNGASIKDMGNGWFRVSMQQTAILTGTSPIYFAVVNSATSVRLETGAGNGKGLYIWGAQFEVKAFPTSYISTQGGSVTRATDALAVTSLNFNNEEFSVVANFSVPHVVSSTSYVWSVNDGVTNNDRVINIIASKKIRTIKTDGGSATADFSGSVDLIGGDLPYASVVTFKNVEVKGYLDGTLYGSDSASAINYANFDNFNIGSSLAGASSLNGHMGKVSIYAQALTQQEITLL